MWIGLCLNGERYAHKSIQICPKIDDERVKLWRKQHTRNWPENISEHHSFRCRNITVWTGISLRYLNDLHIHKRGSVTVVPHLDEGLDPIVKLYASTVGPFFVLIDDNARPNRAAIVYDFLESEETAYREWKGY